MVAGESTDDRPAPHASVRSGYRGHSLASPLGGFLSSEVAWRPGSQGAADLHRLRTLLYAALLEFSLDQEGER